MFHFRQKSPTVDIIRTWQTPDKDFFAPGVLVRVTNGKGMLREVYGEHAQYTYNTLMFGSQPLMQLQVSEYYCPTCEKMLKSGYGLEDKTDFRLDKINDNISFMEMLEQIKPLLGLLQSNYYVIWDTSLYPTDGNGHLFWEIPNKEEYIPGTCIYYYKDKDYTWGNLRPYFTVATEPAKKCNKDRVKYYRSHPEARAIAYFMDGYMTALLDGHHKAMAAALEQRKVNAIVITPCILSQYRTESGEINKRIGFDGTFFDCDEIAMDKSFKPIYGERIKKEELVPLLSQIKSNMGDCHVPYDTKDLASTFPDVKGVAYMDLVGEITEKRLDDIISGKTQCVGEDSVFMLIALSAQKHARLIEMGEYFLGHNFSGQVLYDIAEILVKEERTEQLEEKLIHWMVELEDDYPDVGKLIRDGL